jgi:Polyketide cyclase / dehydrase and lipid transport
LRPPLLTSLHAGSKGRPATGGTDTMLKPKYLVYHSAVFDASPDEVWAVARDILQMVEIVFGDSVENVKWVQSGSVKKVPSSFKFTLLPNHDVVNEEVVGRSESERSLTYRTVGQVLSIVDYLATYRVKPVTNDGRSFLEWSREFRLVEGTNVDEFLSFFLPLMENEIATVKAYFAGGASATRQKVERPEAALVGVL